VHYALLTILGALLAIACASDVAGRRIPNALTAALAVTGLLAQLVSGGVKGAALAAAAGIAVFALLFLAWRSGKLGGGDLKLLAAVAVWVGPERSIGLLLFTGAAGLPVALAAYAFHELRQRRLAHAGADGGQGASPPRTVPMAVAIALGTVATLSWRFP
jgi:prepilin peptidase CpaA